MKSSRFHQTASTHRTLGRRNEAGQALLIAVLVLFAVATLGALFAGVVGSQLAQVSRQSEVVALRHIAEAGLRLANEQLTYSPQGADWRPSDTPYDCGDGRVTIQVSYGPSPDRLQSRFLRILSTAVFPDNPFLRHTILALKPVLLTDYARFVTDRFETNRPAPLGATGMELNGGERSDYIFYVNGPVRSNTDLVWHGLSQVRLTTTFDFDGETDWQDLGILRDDRIEIAGFLHQSATPNATTALNLVIDGEERIANLFDPQTETQQYDYANGFPRVWEGAIIPDSRTVLANLPDFWTMSGDLLAPALSVPRVRPPEIDAIHPDKETNRYLLLTRDSGFWRLDSETGFYYNTGEFGWGWTNFGGIYIDNGPYIDGYGVAHTGDIQYNHDLEKLRLNWTRSVGAHQTAGDLRDEDTERPPTGPADWWDATGRYYAPPGTEIVLHGEDPCPYIEIIRHDLREQDGIEYYWRESNGEPIPADGSGPYPYTPPANGCTPGSGAQPMGVLDGPTAVVPFPPNGVIYAEGNIRIRGVMPPLRDSQGRSGIQIPADDVYEGYFGDWTPSQGRTRRFDLQVVSGGTIYVEGDILTPTTAQLAGLTPDDYLEDRLYGSRIALLARDYVCLNTTALNPRPQDLYSAVEYPPDSDEWHYYNDALPRYASSGNESFLLLEGDISEPQPTPPPTGPLSPYETFPANVSFGYSNSRLQIAALAAEIDNLRLMIGHSGLYVAGAQPGEAGGIGIPSGVPSEGSTPDTDPDEPAVQVAVHINDPELDDPWPWGFDSSPYEFWRDGAPGVDPITQDDSYHWYIDTDVILMELSAPTADDWLELLPNQYQYMTVHDSSAPGDSYLTGSDTITLVPAVWPVGLWSDPGTGIWERYDWEIPPKDLAYVLGPLAVAPTRNDDPLPVEVEALIYAQNGSWFVIPGRWFNDDADELDPGVEPTGDYPGYHEPLNIMVQVYGAITENMPADLGSVADWTGKWGGPAGLGDQGYLAYSYDPLLRFPRRETDNRIGHLRFPNFPMTSDLVIWGERVSGPAGS